MASTISENDFKIGEMNRQNLLALLKRAKKLGIESYWLGPLNGISMAVF